MIQEIETTQTQPDTIILPSGSGAIPLDASLAELREIKRQWVRLADDTGYAAQCWNVLRWMGETVKVVGHNEKYIWRSGDIAMIGGEVVDKYIPAIGVSPQDSWRTKRSVNVWLRSPHADPACLALLPRAHERGDLIAEITFSSILAAHVEWEYVGNASPIMLAERSVFVPGQWLNAILLATPDALAKERNSYQTSGEYERQELLTQLLAGYTV